MMPYLAGYMEKTSQIIAPLEGAGTLANVSFQTLIGVSVLSLLLGGGAGLSLGYAGGKQIGGRGRPELSRERLKTNEMEELLGTLKYREGMEQYKSRGNTNGGREIHI